MPALIELSLTALRYDRTSGRWVALAEALQTVSHDRLTSLLQAGWSGHTRLEVARRTLFTWAQEYRILDDTVRAKPFATALERLAWVFSSQERRSVHGVSLVLRIWTNGTLRSPLGRWRWRQGGPSQYELALE